MKAILSRVVLALIVGAILFAPAKPQAAVATVVTAAATVVIAVATVSMAWDAKNARNAPCAPAQQP